MAPHLFLLSLSRFNYQPFQLRADETNTAKVAVATAQLLADVPEWLVPAATLASARGRREYAPLTGRV